MRFEIKAIAKWKPHASGGAVSAALAELTRIDPADDVDWVVGFVTGIELADASRHRIGVARTLGKHFVVVTTTDVDEWDSLKRHYDLASDEKRMKIHAERKVHREVLTFLHEWGHNLGALHLPDSKFFMGPTHSYLATSFAPENAQLIRIGLRFRDRQRRGTEDPSIRRAWRRQILSAIAQQPGARWDPRSKAQLIAHIEEAGKANVRDVSTELTRAELLLKNKHFADARATIVELANRWHGLSRHKPKQRDWRRLASIAAQLELVSVAERAARRAGPGAGAGQVLKWATTTRRRLGLPENADRLGVTITAEPHYLAQMREALKLLDDGAVARAKEKARALASEFPNAPGPQIPSCRLHLARGSLKRARKACTAAVNTDPRSSVGHLLLCMIRMRRGKLREAVSVLRAIIEHDESLGVAWIQLARAYKRMGEHSLLQTLCKDYEAKFSRPLRD